MSAFRFRLQNLLQLRLHDRQERRSELAISLAAEAVLRREREALDAERAENTALLRKLAAPGAGDVQAMLRVHQYERALECRSTQLAAQEAELRQEIECRRQALVEADRQVKTLERLAERQALEHKRLADKREIERLDEIGALEGFRRQQNAA